MQVNILLEEGLKATGVPLPDEFAHDPDKDDLPAAFVTSDPPRKK